MDILLIFPPHGRLTGIKVNTFPVGLGSIATVLKQDGFDVGIYNAEETTVAEENARKTNYMNLPKDRTEAFSSFQNNLHDKENIIWHEAREVIKRLRPKIVGITSYMPTYSCVKKIAKIAKEVSDCQVIVGGPYSTMLPKDAIGHDWVDYAVIGEGEYTMLELANYLLRGQGNREKIKGLCFRHGGDIIITPERERIADLDALPFIDYSLVVNKKSNVTRWSSIIASRGCPYRCTFCANVPIWGRRIACRSARSLVDEIERNYNKYGGKNFRFYDDIFTSNVKNTIEFCNLFIERGLSKKLSWGCLTRINIVTPELLRALEKANCRSIALGVESGSERILKTLKKDITKDLVRAKMKLIRRSKLKAHLYFMVGTPYEKEEDVIETYNFIKELKPYSVNLTTFTPYYGTELYNVCVRKGILPEKHDVSMYEKIGHQSKYNYFCLDIPRERYQELVDMMMALANATCRRISWKKIVTKSHYCLKHPVSGFKLIKRRLFA